MCPVTRTVFKGNVEIALIKPTYAPLYSVACRAARRSPPSLPPSLPVTHSRLPPVPRQQPGGDHGLHPPHCQARDARSHFGRGAQGGGHYPHCWRAFSPLRRDVSPFGHAYRLTLSPLPHQQGNSAFAASGQELMATKHLPHMTAC